MSLHVKATVLREFSRQKFLQKLNIHFRDKQTFLASLYLHKVNKNTRKMHEICLKATVKTPEQFIDVVLVVFIVNFGDISLFFSSVFIVDFEYVFFCCCC